MRASTASSRWEPRGGPGHRGHRGNPSKARPGRGASPRSRKQGGLSPQRCPHARWGARSRGARARKAKSTKRPPRVPAEIALRLARRQTASRKRRQPCACNQPPLAAVLAEISARQVEETAPSSTTASTELARMGPRGHREQELPRQLSPLLEMAPPSTKASTVLARGPRGRGEDPWRGRLGLPKPLRREAFPRPHTGPRFRAFRSACQPAMDSKSERSPAPRKAAIRLGILYGQRAPRPPGPGRVPQACHLALGCQRTAGRPRPRATASPRSVLRAPLGA